MSRCQGAIVGIDSMVRKHGSVAKLKDAITQSISDNIDPIPEYEFLEAHIDKQDILVINVYTDTAKCYAVYQSKDTPVYYIRRGATTRVADNNEIQALVRLKSVSLPVMLSQFEQ